MLRKGQLRKGQLIDTHGYMFSGVSVNGLLILSRRIR